MCILDEDDLFKLISDKKFFARLNLTDRQRRVVKLHILKGVSFKIIAGFEVCSVSAVHDVYTDALEKIGKQLVKMLQEKREKPVPLTMFPQENYIGGDGEPGDRVFGMAG